MITTFHSSASRRSVPWSMFTNERLKFAHDLLALHSSPFECEVANEIEQRILAGCWLDLDYPPPPLYKLNLEGFLPYLALLITWLLASLLVGGWYIWGQ